MEFPIVISCYYWGVFVVRSVPRGTMRLSPPPPSAKQALSQEEARIKRYARLAPLESQTAKALVLRRRCDPPGCEEIVGGAAQGQDDITALGGVLELRVFRKSSLCVVK